MPKAVSDILRESDSASAFAAGGGAWTTVFKAADTVRASNTTLSADPDLKFAMLANQKYAFRLCAIWETLAAADIKFRHVGPAIGSGLIKIFRQHILPGTTALVVAIETAYSAADISMTTAVAPPGFGVLWLDGIIHNGANAGDFALQWAQVTSTAGANATRVMAGSYIESKQL